MDGSRLEGQWPRDSWRESRSLRPDALVWGLGMCRVYGCLGFRDV